MVMLVQKAIIVVRLDHGVDFETCETLRPRNCPTRWPID